MNTITVNENDSVLGQLGYLVALAGTYQLDALVPCKQLTDTAVTCAFLGYTVAGLELPEQANGDIDESSV